MTKKIWVLLMAVLCMLSVFTVTVKAADNMIENNETGIPDPVLYKKILGILNKNETDKFTEQEAESIQKISFTQYEDKVGTFRGIGYLKNLADLKVFEITTENLEEIAMGVPNLKRLAVRGYDTMNAYNFVEEDRRQINSLKALENMKDLTYLDVSYNKLAGFDGIEGLNQLETLLARGNQFAGEGEIEKLAGLEKLAELDLSENNLSDVKGIRGLTNLKILYLCRNRMRTLGEAAELKNLTVLDISGNQLEDIDGIRNLKSLKNLWLSDNCLTNIVDIKYLKNLKELSVRDNKIECFPTFKVLRRLEYLDAENNELKFCPKLKKAKQLKTVRLSWNYLKKKDIKNSIPKKFWSSTSLMDQVWKEQKGNVKIKYNSPKKKKKITKNTKKIVGEVTIKNYKSSINFYIRLPDGKTHSKVQGWTGADYARKNGKYKFTLRKLDLREYVGKEVELRMKIGETLADFTIDRFIVQE